MRAAGARWTQVLRELGEVNASLQAECWGLPPEWRGAVEHVRREPSSIIQHIYIYIYSYILCNNDRLYYTGHLKSQHWRETCRISVIAGLETVVETSWPPGARKHAGPGVCVGQRVLPLQTLGFVARA